MKKKFFRIVAAIVIFTDCRATDQVQWPSVGGDWGNGRYSTLSQVNIRTVKTLGAAWTVQLGAAAATSAIVVEHNRLFVTAGAEVYKLDPANGRILWSYKPAATPSAKGVAVGGGRVYVGLSNADLIALDESSGALLWTVKIGDEGWKGVNLGRQPAQVAGQRHNEWGQYISAAPAYFGERVIVGLGNGDSGVRGRIVSVDAATGRRLWQFFTVPGPGEKGNETWPSGSDLWKTGGGGVWMNPAIDPALGMVYLGVGNPVPQWGGEIRPGDNLFTDSVVALDIRTGKLKWFFQGVHHDIWDHDFGTPLVLFDTALNGQQRHGLAVMRTDGYLFQLDRETGKPLRPIVERRVPYSRTMKMSSTQPFPVGVDPIGPRCVEEDAAPAAFKRKCYFDEFGDEPNLLFPFDTTRAAPMSFSPQTGYFYVTAGVTPNWLQRSDDPYYYGVFQPAVGLRHYGLITALDSQTGKIIWQKRVANRLDAGSGATSTAGGLVFHGDPDGHLQAYDAKTGNLLWSFQTGAPANGPVSTYEINGEQYVAVGARELWAFKLGGLVPPRAAPSAPPSETGSSGPIIPSETIEIATTVFDIGVTGKHELFDEYAFRPVRTRVAPGATITWVNQGKRTHTISARDGSWTTGPIAAGRSKSMNMPKTGRYSFICREHPWSTGELIVEGGSTDPQADRGGVLYQSHCAVCHRNDLAGQEPAPQLAGFAFQSRWSGRTLGDLYDLIHTTMPLGKPNSLSGQEYLDIVKFVLSANDIPLSNKDLTADSSELRSQRIPAP